MSITPVPPSILFLQDRPVEEVVLYANRGVSLEGGLSVNARNRVFEVSKEKYVIHDIGNEVELYMMQQTGCLGVAPRVIRSFPEEKLLVMEYIEDSTITPLIAQDHCQEIGEALKKAHGIPLFKEKGMSFEAANQERWDYIQAQAPLHQTEWSKSLLSSAAKAMQVLTSGIEEMRQSNFNLTANIHTDLHPRNLFWTNDKRFLMIDWESSSHGHPYFDVASLSIFLGLDEIQEKELLLGYFGRFPTDEELKEYTLLKKIRWAYTSIVNAMWAYRVSENKTVSQDTVPPPNKNFGGYMQSFAEKKDEISLEFFVNVSRLAFNEINQKN